MSGSFGRVNRTGEGRGIGHAGELLQGALWHEAIAEPFLVTLPAPPFVSRAKVEYVSESDGDRVLPTGKIKALRAARVAWTALGGSEGSLRLTIRSRTPVGRGCGSSTSDCVAAIRAVSDLLGRVASAAQIAQWSAAAETASDSTMFGLQPVAFRQRRGRVLRPLGSSYPPMRVISVDLGGPSVDTVSHAAPAYSETEIASFEDLLAHLERSIERQDASGVAEVASASASIHQRYSPQEQWPEFAAIVGRAGALGLGCAHSGNVAMALLSPSDAAAEQRILSDLLECNLPVVARYTLAPGGQEGDASCPLS